MNEENCILGVMRQAGLFSSNQGLGRDLVFAE